MIKPNVFLLLPALLAIQVLAMEKTQESQHVKKQIIYFRSHLGYLYSQSEFLVFLAKENFDSQLHKPPSARVSTLSAESKRDQHNESILFEFKRALTRKADIMVVDKQCNSLMHLVLHNSWVPSRNLIKILLPGTLWLESNTQGNYAFDYLDPYEKHTETADLIIHDVMRFICKKKKINFKQIKQRYTQDQQYSMLKSYFAKITAYEHYWPQMTEKPTKNRLSTPLPMYKM